MFEDNKELIRIRNSKDKQYNAQKKMKQNIRTKYFIEFGVNSIVPEQSITVETNTSTGINSGTPEQSLAVETSTLILTAPDF